jgi:hypothetical protein
VNRALAATPIPWARSPTDIAPQGQNTGSGAGQIPGQTTASYKASAGSYTGIQNGWPFNNQDRRNGFFYRDSAISMNQVQDGMSNTIMVGEITWTIATNGRLFGSVSNVGYADGNSPRLISAASGDRNISFGSLHEGGAHFLFGDGTVRFISENIQHTSFLWAANNPYDRTNNGTGYGVYQRLFSRADGLPLSQF